MKELSAVYELHGDRSCDQSRLDTTLEEGSDEDAHVRFVIHDEE